jgi:hypothetical protein
VQRLARGPLNTSTTFLNKGFIPQIHYKSII